MAIWRRLFVTWLLVLARMHVSAAPRTAVVIALDGAIGPGSASFVVRSLNAAQRQDAAVAVLRLNTPGGLDSAMRDIIRAMLASPVPVLAYVAPGGARAASAGTFILYAAALSAMAPGTKSGRGIAGFHVRTDAIGRIRQQARRRRRQDRPARQGRTARRDADEGDQRLRRADPRSCHLARAKRRLGGEGGAGGCQPALRRRA